MAYFALVNNSDGEVVNVIIATQEVIDSGDIDEEGKSFVEYHLDTRGGVVYDEDGNATDTAHLRYNSASIGGTYDSSADAFYEEQPHSSWTLNTTNYLWEAPITMPDDDVTYTWDEDAYQADTADPKTLGWIPLSDTFQV